MHGAAQRADNCEQQLYFFTRAMVGPKQELITVIQEETKGRSDPDFQTYKRNPAKMAAKIYFCRG